MEVEQVSWPPEHSQALREYHAKGMSYSQIAKALNARFATAYTRSAALGRAKRMGLVGSDQNSGAAADARADAPRTGCSSQILRSQIV